LTKRSLSHEAYNQSIIGKDDVNPPNRKYTMFYTVVRERPGHSYRRVTCTENCVKFEHAAFEICERTTDRQRETDGYTDTLFAIRRTLPGDGEVITPTNYAYNIISKRRSECSTHALQGHEKVTPQNYR